jgi:hypothetical protein
MTGQSYRLPCDRPVTLSYVRKVGLRQNHVAVVRWGEAAMASDCLPRAIIIRGIIGNLEIQTMVTFCIGPVLDGQMPVGWSATALQSLVRIVYPLSECPLYQPSSYNSTQVGLFAV